MRNLLICFLIISALIIGGCNKKSNNNEKVAEQYVTDHGYTITSQLGEIEKYLLEENMLTSHGEYLPYQQMWTVQKTDSNKYIGNEIIIHGLTVKNHPLEKIDQNFKSVNVYIMVSEAEVIGGYSYPNANNDDTLYGTYYSLDGKTLEELTN